MIRLYLHKDVTIRGLEPEYAKHVYESFILDNPMYAKMKKMGKYVGKMRRVYKYAERTTDTEVVVPSGSLARVKDWLDKCDLPFTVSDHTISNKIGALERLSIPTLREHQVPLADKVVLANGGVLVAGTGTGKSILACETIRRLNLTATIIVPTNVILAQFKETLTDLFDYEPGIVNGKEKNIKDITIATWQTLHSDDVSRETLAKQTSILIVDECHGAVTDKRLKILRSFAPKHLYGFTATPTRSIDDGRTDAIYMHLGPIIHTYAQTECTPTVEVKTTGTPYVNDEYHKLVDQMVDSESRNKLIAGLALGSAVSGKKVLILTKRVKHIDNLREIIGERKNVYYIDSKDKNKEQTLLELRNGDREFSILVGTTSLLATGTDVPSLDTLILAGDLKSNNLTVQAAGRILRLFDGKPDPLIYDLYDHKSFVFANQFKHRLKVYRAKKWEVVNLPPWM